MKEIFEWSRCKKTGILSLGAIFILVILCSSCTKRKGTYQVAIKNTTPFRLVKLTLSCGAEPINFDISANSISIEQTLEFAGREIVNPIFLNVGVMEYLNDTTIVKNNIISQFNRQALKEGQVNFILVKVDSTKLPEVKFNYAFEE
jgi:hypothetical protein